MTEYEYAFAGTWNQGTTVDTVGRVAAAEHVVAGIGVVHWNHLQPNPGSSGFDFNGLDPLLFAAALNFSRPLPLVVAFGAGDETPPWVYESGVPEVYTHPPGNNRSGPYPYPLDPTYVSLYKAAVTGLADHIASLPTAVRRNVIALQINFGASSEFTPYYGHPINGSYNITAGKSIGSTAHGCTEPLRCFDTWDLHIWQLAKELCAMTRARGMQYSQWNKGTFAWNRAVRAVCPGSFVHGQTEGYMLNLELSSNASDNMNMRPICRNVGGCYGESPFYDTGTSRPHPRAGYQTESPLWSLYWQLLWQLTAGNNMPSFQEVALTNESFAPLFSWFTKVAPRVAPRQQWAIIALRDGLDSNDTARFPEDQFGKATYKNKARLLNIAAAFAERGAREEDPAAAASIGNGAASFNRRGMNDVGWNVYRDNYGVRLAQLAPRETSVGWWRVGPPTQWYGRFGRGFHHASGRDTMGFVLDESMGAKVKVKGLSKNGSASGGALSAGIRQQEQVSYALRVVWFSNATSPGARFAIQYDSLSGGCKSAFEADVASSGIWLEKTITVQDARFGGANSSCRMALPNAAGNDDAAVMVADMLLVNKGAMQDVVFHMIEVTGLPGSD